MRRGLGDLFPVSNPAGGPLSILPQPAALEALQRLYGLPATGVSRTDLSALEALATPGPVGMPAAAIARSVGSAGVCRSQFAYPPAPAGFRDEEFIHFYDSISNPALGVTLAAGEILRDVVFPIETDAAFLARAIQVLAVGAGVQFREPGGKLLSSNFVSTALAYISAFVVLPAGTIETMVIPLEPEIACPPGSVFLANFQNLLGFPAALTGQVSIYGVKRYAVCS